jgi:bacterioferritin-associated ferredoxin
MGITLLSEYETSQKPVNVRHEQCGHLANKSWNELQSGRGCGKCAKNARVLDEDYEAVAVQFGGRLLRKVEQSIEDSEWECALGHVFRRSFTSIKALQTFCTKCSSSYAEMLCRAMAETLFGATFRCIRIKDMRSVKGRPLELDIFNEELRLAIEHNGAHHYEAQHNWGGDKALVLQRKNDKRRRVYCRKNGILLIEIRELGKKTSVEQAREEIREALVRAKRKIPPHFDKVDLRLLKPKTETEAYWQAVNSAAAQMGLTILPCVYESADKNVPVECSKGHKTMKTPRSILQGHKCDECNSLRMKKAVRLSDGREFESGTEAAKALGVTKETVNRAAVAGWRVKGLYVRRIGKSR